VTALDSETWTCQGCQGVMIGRRPSDDRCILCRTRPDVTALPAALRRLADALDDVLSLAALSDPQTVPAPTAAAAPVPVTAVPVRAGRGPHCRWCHHPMPDSMRVDAQYCSTACRKTAWRARTGRS
jgi:hypothetical protein